MATKKEIQAQLDALQAAREEMELLQRVAAISSREINRDLSTAFKFAKDLNKEARTLADLKKKAKDQQVAILAAMRGTRGPLRESLKLELERAKAMEQYAEENERVVNLMRQQISLSKALGNSMVEIAKNTEKGFLSHLRSVPLLLLEADKAVRSMNLEMGASGENAARLERSLQGAYMHTEKLGVSFADLAQIQGEYASLTGKIVGLSDKELIAVSQIAKGTALGASGAAQMAASYESLGYTADRVAQHAENLVNRSEAFGLNASVVVKELNANFANAQKYTFTNGARGIEQMALQAAKLKISMQDTFAAADKARTLEGSLKMASHLMVMGGNFAKTDPFQLSFLARNKPEEFQQKIADMTKGVARFNATTGEFEVSAVNLDRLREVGEATGIEFDKLKMAAIEMARVDMAKAQILGGTAEEKDLIAKLAKVGKNGKFTVDIGGDKIDIKNLTSQQIDLLKQQEKTLQQRAEDSQSFDEAWKNFVMGLKQTALPLLKELNTFTSWFKGFLDSFRDSNGSLSTLAKTILGGYAAIKALQYTGMAGRALGGIKGIGLGASISKFFTGGGGATAASTVTGGATGGGAAGGAGGGLGKLMGGGSAAAIAAIGAAAVGLGYGLKLASEGFATLADSMAKLSGEQVWGLVASIVALSAGFAGFGLALTTLGANPVAWAGAGVVAAVGASMIGMGYGIKLATDGVAGMMNSFSNLAGIDTTALTGVFDSATNFLEADSGNISKMQEMLMILSATENKVLSEVKDLLSKPLRMEIGGGEVAIVVNLTAQIDSDVLVKHTAKKMAVQLAKIKQGKR